MKIIADESVDFLIIAMLLEAGFEVYSVLENHSEEVPGLAFQR
jgi:hypothetical protein